MRDSNATCIIHSLTSDTDNNTFNNNKRWPIEQLADIKCQTHSRKYSSAQSTQAHML